MDREVRGSYRSAMASIFTIICYLCQTHTGNTESGSGLVISDGKVL